MRRKKEHGRRLVTGATVPQGVTPEHLRNAEERECILRAYKEHALTHAEAKKQLMGLFNNAALADEELYIADGGSDVIGEPYRSKKKTVSRE